MLQRLLLTLCIVALVQSSSAEQSSIPAYDRGEFGRWIDHDSDCLNTRHELLAALSTGALLYSDNGCRVLRGRWIDPYTDTVFMDSSDLDVDHLVIAHERTPFTEAALKDGQLDGVIAQDPGHLVRSAVRKLKAITDKRVAKGSQERIRVEVLLRTNI